MPKDDAGLFSKVVKFVKNPTTSWADLDQPEAERESGYSKQMLKEMIERKRRNDFVRKREFDMLRKLRRSEAMAGHDLAARPSFFQSSMPSKPDDRATTLKKIDEIEAQMSMQWWKTKHGGQGTSGGPNSSQFASSHIPLESLRAPLAPAAPASKMPGAYTSTEPQPLAPTQAPKVAEPGELMPAMNLQPQPTVAAGTPVPAQDVPRFTSSGLAPFTGAREAAGGKPPAPAKPVMSALSPLGPSSDASTGFTASKLFAIDVEEFAHDPELEEAAIRFANGDDEGAEAGLREVLSPQGTRADHDETWLTLFDLYRATGKQDRFEAAAIDFAGRLGRSAPQWFSMPALVAQSAPPGASAPAAAPGQPLAHWTAPATIGTQSIAAMTAGLAKATPPWKLNWSKVAAIDQAALEGLARVFAQWSAEPVQLRFIGAEALEKLLKDATPSGDRGVDPGWWKLRMEALRLMHRPDEFELVALDYCVTYEVSPPSWERARCEYKQLQPDGSYVPGHTIVGEAFHDSLSSGYTGFGDSQEAQSTQMAQVSTIELGGQVLGDAKEMMELLESKLQGADIIIISCARLIRIDFTAAGSLLNWVSARQAEGRQVQFVDVHRLVAAFFNVIGISEHSRVIARTD